MGGCVDGVSQGNKLEVVLENWKTIDFFVLGVLTRILDFEVLEHLELFGLGIYGEWLAGSEG